MRADEVLVEHHTLLRGLLGDLARTTTDDVRQRHELLDRMTTELGIHTQIEDEIFYPAAREASPLVWLAHAEHRQIDDQLAVLLRTDPAGADFATELRLFTQVLEHHAREEEQEMFPQAHALGEEELERLGERLRARQQELRGSRLTQLRLRLKRGLLRRL